MIIGFTQRMQTVSEGRDPTVDLFPLNIDVAVSRRAEREYKMVFRYEANSTAKVEPLLSQSDPDFDAIFGNRDRPGKPIQEVFYLQKGNDTVPPLTISIRNDFVPEEEECFTIRIIPERFDGSSELFLCYEDNIGAARYFCQHTICIANDDSKQRKSVTVSL